jgi:outer membrane murein-binding lipoprotein Lpp
MRRLNITLTAGACACALVAGCTTTTKQTTYWTEKSGIVTVHHVVGKVDQAEKLTEKRLTKEEIAAYKLPKGTYFRVESEQIDTPTTSAEAEPKAKTKDTESGASNDRIAEKIDDLRREVQTVVAQNQRLQDQINNASTQQPVQQGSQQRTAQDNLDAPKLSQ